MAERDNCGKRTNTATAPDTSNTATPDALEQRVVAFAEQLGRMAGTVQAKAEGWMDRDALNKQITSVRDSAADLLEQLSEGVTSLRGTAKTAIASAASGRRTAKAAAAAWSTPRARSTASRRRATRARWPPTRERRTCAPARRR